MHLPQVLGSYKNVSHDELLHECQSGATIGDLSESRMAELFDAGVWDRVFLLIHAMRR